MKSQRLVACLSAALVMSVAAGALAQSPSVLYTWSGTGNIQQWAKGFGTNTAAFDNTIAGELRFVENGTAGSTIAVSDGFNRIRETPNGGSGGLDLTGLDYLELEVGHNGAGNVNVQFYVQATPGSNFVALGPDLAVTPGVNTYQVPLTGLTAAQAVYVRTVGLNIRDHAALGNLEWTIREVRSGGTPLMFRDLITHSDPAIDGGRQGAIANFDQAAIQGNDGGQNQSGMSHNPAGTGSLQWTDLGGSNGAAVGWGNGTAWNGNTFNNRQTDLSNYQFMTVRMSATDLPTTDPASAGGAVNVQAYFQRNNFSFQSVANLASLPIDGQYHELTFPLAALTLMNSVDLTGINLGSHTNSIVINVDNIRFYVPEPATATMFGVAAMGICLGRRQRRA